MLRLARIGVRIPPFTRSVRGGSHPHPNPLPIKNPLPSFTPQHPTPANHLPWHNPTPSPSANPYATPSLQGHLPTPTLQFGGSPPPPPAGTATGAAAGDNSIDPPPAKVKKPLWRRILRWFFLLTGSFLLSLTLLSRWFQDQNESLYSILQVYPNLLLKLRMEGLEEDELPDLENETTTSSTSPSSPSPSPIEVFNFNQWMQEITPPEDLKLLETYLSEEWFQAFKAQRTLTQFFARLNQAVKSSGKTKPRMGQVMAKKEEEKEAAAAAAAAGGVESEPQPPPKQKREPAVALIPNHLLTFDAVASVLYSTASRVAREGGPPSDVARLRQLARDTYGIGLAAATSTIDVHRQRLQAIKDARITGDRDVATEKAKEIERQAMKLLPETRDKLCRTLIVRSLMNSHAGRLAESESDRLDAQQILDTLLADGADDRSNASKVLAEAYSGANGTWFVQRGEETSAQVKLKEIEAINAESQHDWRRALTLRDSLYPFRLVANFHPLDEFGPIWHFVRHAHVALQVGDRTAALKAYDQGCTFMQRIKSDPAQAKSKSPAPSLSDEEIIACEAILKRIKAAIDRNESKTRR